ncbi:hypothetical protein [Paraburkholderia sp. RL17-373-BIF-A]|uniref:hypothetical protein n=1 Tax=Paraburkholderia sp. RL17-373-BIF-A TaxID=3031629 RepID=UPI0038BA5D14
MGLEMDGDIEALFRQFSTVAHARRCVSVATLSVDSEVVGAVEFEDCVRRFLSRVGFDVKREAFTVCAQSSGERFVWVALTGVPRKRWVSEVRQWLPLENNYRVAEFGLPLGI